MLVTALGELLVFHGVLYGAMRYTSHANDLYDEYRENFRSSINKYQILQASLHRLIEETAEFCEESFYRMSQTKQSLSNSEENSYYDFILVWGTCLRMRNKYDHIRRESDRIEQNINQYCALIINDIKRYESIKKRNYWMYLTSTLVLLGCIEFYYTVPSHLFKSSTLKKIAAASGVNLLIGLGIINLAHKCSAYEEKSMRIVYKRFESNIYDLSRDHFEFMSAIKCNMAVDMESYESLALKTIKYCDIQGYERRIARLKLQLITKNESLQNQFNNVVYNKAPAKLSNIRTMHYKKNPVDLLCNTFFD